MIDLDHVAIATSDVGPILDALVGDLGAQVLWGGANFGFRAMQVDAGDLRIELLEPYNVDQNDFLERFLKLNGEGPHHLTFKTDDIVALLATVEAAGYHPVGINIDNPFWKEAFIHPKEAGGTVVQVAQSGIDSPMEIPPAVISHLLGDEGERAYGPLEWWPAPPPPGPDKATLRRVVVTTDEMSVALGLYLDLLCGVREDFGDGFVDLAWPGGGRIRLEHAAGRRAGIDRFEWTHTGPVEERRVGGALFVLGA